MKRTLFVFLLAATCLPQPASASEPAPVPEATFLISAGAFAEGQSSNLGPAVTQILQEYYVVPKTSNGGVDWEEFGQCPDSNGSYLSCDELQFGLSIYADSADAEGLPCDEEVVQLVMPGEDQGFYVENRISNIHNEGGDDSPFKEGTWCHDLTFRPDDSGLDEHHRLTFPLRDAITEAALDAYWERPHLTLLFVGDLPQTADNAPDDRVINSLRVACSSFEGGPSGELPSMPTWVMATRRADHSMIPYAELLSAAGGTGVCCYGHGCNPGTDPLDVCAHIEDGRSDAKIRADLVAGKYNCGAGSELHSTGSMDFGTSQMYGQLKDIRCMLSGPLTTRCSPEFDIDLLGIFSCIRQLPRGVPADDVDIEYCGANVTPTEDAADGEIDGCILLTEANGGLTFIDDRKTLFVINNRDQCEISAGGGVEVNYCFLTGQYCLVDGAYGRCAAGQYECIDKEDVCVPILAAMPEICNGLDDDCDGTVDNFADSWPNFSDELPPEHEGLDCDLDSVCVCPDGATDNHAGDDFETYLDAWDGVCQCGEGLGPNDTPAPDDSDAPMDDQASCSAASEGAATALLPLMVLGMIVRRRQKR